MASARAKEVRPLPAWLAGWVSVALHAIVVGLLGLPGGAPDRRGERGREGAGGDTIEVSVIEGRMRPSPGPREPPIEPRQDTAIRGVPSERAPRVRTAPQADRDRVRAGDAPSPAGESTPPPAAEPPARLGHEDGTDRTRSGRSVGDEGAAALILGSIGLGGPGAGERALLERALACADPIEGVWVAHRFSPEHHDWARMTLRIDREGERLTGTIVSRAWSGLATDRRPPITCAPDAHDVTVRMVARGWIRGEDLSFGADTHEIQRTDCPSRFFSYNPDHFTGRIDTLREQIDALNNDGGRDVNAPYRFRRVACLEDEAPR